MLYLLVYYIFEVCLLPRTSSYKYVQSQTQCTEEQQRTKTTSCYDSRKTSPLVGSPVLPRSGTQAPSNHQQSPALSHCICNHSTGLRNCQLRKNGYHLSAFGTFPDNYMNLIFPFFRASAVNYWKTKNLKSLKWTPKISCRQFGSIRDIRQWRWQRDITPNYKLESRIVSGWSKHGIRRHTPILFKN